MVNSYEKTEMTNNANDVTHKHKTHIFLRETIQNMYLAIGFFFSVGINTKSLKSGILQVKNSKRGYSEVFPFFI
jgi:hypothetical protein